MHYEMVGYKNRSVVSCISKTQFKLIVIQHRYYGTCTGDCVIILLCEIHSKNYMSQIAKNFLPLSFSHPHSLSAPSLSSPCLCMHLSLMDELIFLGEICAHPCASLPTQMSIRSLSHHSLTIY